MPPEMMQYGMGNAQLDLSLLELAVYAAVILVMVIGLFVMMAVFSLPIFFAALLGLEGGLRAAQALPDPVGKFAKLSGLVFRSLRRNLLRTALTYVALFVLTGMLTLIYSVVAFLGKMTEEQEENVKIIMTEKFNIPSQMKPGYANELKRIMETELPPEFRPKNLTDDFMTWSFVGGTLDLKNRTPENTVFFFALDPGSVLTMMDGVSEDDIGADGRRLLEEAIAVAQQDRRNVVIGEDRLKTIGKRVGDEIKLYGTNYADIEFDLKIVASFPSGSRLANSAAMHVDYLYAKLDEYKKVKGKDHPVADRCLNLVWARLPSKPAFERLAAVVNEPGKFSNPQVKLETASAGISSFLDAYKDIFWGMKWIIMPAVFVIMCLVVGITITISVRERWPEMAIMKVLGFQPWQIMSMILGEAVLIGVMGGMLSTWTVYWVPKLIQSSAKFQVAFFNNFRAVPEILYYGPAIGILVGLIGSALPSRAARKVKVSEVFAKVA